MSVTKVENGMFFQDASHLYITPYTSESVPSDNTYDIRAIVADSMSIEQDDNETNTKDWEFGDTPLLENVTLGSFQFSATCIDFQNDILANLFGCTPSSDGKTLMFPSQYEDKYVAIRITFANTNSKDVILPKVKLNSKAVISTLKTGSAEGTISGTAYATAVMADKSATTVPGVETPMFFAEHPASEGASTWAIQTTATTGSISNTGDNLQYSTINYGVSAS